MKKRASSGFEAADPFLDWFLILAIATAVALILVGTGVSVYLGTRARLGVLVAPTGDKASAPFDQAALAQIVAGFSARSAEHEAVMARWAPPADPSVP